LQTSDALGAAAAQLGPDAQAAIVELNKQGGLSHGKVTRCLASLFASLSAGAAASTPCSVPPPAASRSMRLSARPWANLRG
jgi:hypothetical protein